MDSVTFKKILTTIACLSYDEVIGIYGDSLGVHIWDNYIKNKVAEDRLSFLFRVDDICVQSLLDYVNAKIDKRTIICSKS